MTSEFHQGSKSYIALFDAYSRHSSREEAEATLGDTKSNQFSVAKTYLNKQILKSLRSFHMGFSISAQIQTNLHDVEVLFRKGLVPQANKLLRSTRQLASKYERFGLLLETLNWERKLNMIDDQALRTEQEIYAETADLLEKHMNLLTYQSLYNQLIEYKQQFGYARGDDNDDLQAIMQSPLLVDQGKALSSRARFYYHLILSNYHYLVAEHEEGYKASSALVNDELQALDEFEYLEGTLEHVSTCIFYDRLGEALHYLNQVQEIQDNMPIGRFDQIRTKVFYFRANYEMMIYLDTGQVEPLRRKVIEVELGLKELDGKLTKEMELLLWGALANRYFFLGDLKKARHWNQKVLNVPRAKVRDDIHHGARFMHLFILIETGQWDLFHYALNSAARFYRQLHQKEPIYGIKLLTLEHLRMLPDNTQLCHQKQVAMDLEAALQRDYAAHYELRLREEYDVLKYWIESRLTGRSVLDLRLEHATALESFQP